MKMGRVSGFGLRSPGRPVCAKLSFPPQHRRERKRVWTVLPASLQKRENARPQLSLSILQHERDLEVDAILNNLILLDDHLLILHPGASNVFQRLAGASDSYLY